MRFAWASQDLPCSPYGDTRCGEHTSFDEIRSFRSDVYREIKIRARTSRAPSIRESGRAADWHVGSLSVFKYNSILELEVLHRDRHKLQVLQLQPYAGLFLGHRYAWNAASMP